MVERFAQAGVNGMSDRIFVDTNILIYAHDRDAGEKYRTAAAIVEGLWTARTGVVSTQVLQEFYVNITKKIPTPLSRAMAADLVRGFLAWRVVTVTPSIILKAFEIEKRSQISFWDSMIVSAALKANSTKILSEDLKAGQEIAGMMIENPLA